MKKLQLSIVILSLLCCSHAAAAVFTVTSAFTGNYSDLEHSLQSASVSMENNIAGDAPLYPNFDPDFDLHPYIFSDAGIEDISLDIDIDTADSTDGSEMNDRGESLTSSALKEIPTFIVRSIALKVFNFPTEVSRLRI